MQNSFDFKDKYPYKAGHRNVDTSIKSAEKINKHLKRISKIVLVELAKVYPNGLTGSEIAKNAKIFLKNISTTKSLDDEVIKKYAPNVVEGTNKLVEWSKTL